MQERKGEKHAWEAASKLAIPMYIIYMYVYKYTYSQNTSRLLEKCVQAGETGVPVFLWQTEVLGLGQGEWQD